MSGVGPRPVDVEGASPPVWVGRHGGGGHVSKGKEEVEVEGGKSGGGGGGAGPSQRKHKHKNKHQGGEKKVSDAAGAGTGPAVLLSVRRTGSVVRIPSVRVRPRLVAQVEDDSGATLDVTRPSPGIALITLSHPTQHVRAFARALSGLVGQLRRNDVARVQMGLPSNLPRAALGPLDDLEGVALDIPSGAGENVLALVEGGRKVLSSALAVLFERVLGVSDSGFVSGQSDASGPGSGPGAAGAGDDERDLETPRALSDESKVVLGLDPTLDGGEEEKDGLLSVFQEQGHWSLVVARATARPLAADSFAYVADVVNSLFPSSRVLVVSHGPTLELCLWAPSLSVLSSLTLALSYKLDGPRVALHLPSVSKSSPLYLDESLVRACVCVCVCVRVRVCVRVCW